MEETLNGLMEVEADTLCKARYHERNAEVASTRAVSYQQFFQATAGQVQLRVPKLSLAKGIPVLSILRTFAALEFPFIPVTMR